MKLQFYGNWAITALEAFKKHGDVILTDRHSDEQNG